MKAHRLLVLASALIALGCEGRDELTGPRPPSDASKIIRDGAHGGNKDFFFLPPMVPLPLNNPDFELGKFNNALRPSLTIEICELDLTLAASRNVQGLPTDAAPCAASKPLIKKFDAGSIQLVNLPLRQNGWWTLFNLPPDGFYYALWDTRQSNLSVNKYYRIKVLLAGTTEPLGVADVDPMSNLFQWKYTNTGQVIQLVDNVLLPIPFRVEQGALCDGSVCNSATYTNTGTTPLTLRVDPEQTGSIAGVAIPSGALPSGGDCTPATCPQSVVVTITEVPTGQLGSGLAAAAATLCHPALPLYQQFRGCFKFTTTPALRRINAAGDQFTKDVTVAVCYELQGTGDPREHFAELYSSDPDENEAPHPLRDVPEGTLLGALTKDCSAPVITARSSNPLIQFASSGWRALKGGVARVFGVKTAYAVDLGLGGLTRSFSNISPVLPATIQAATFTDVTLQPGQHSLIVGAKITGNHSHSGDGIFAGVNGVPVSFAVTPGSGDLNDFNEGSGTPDVTVSTASVGDGVAFDGIAQVEWRIPSAPGTYTMTASGSATGGPIIYTATVPPPFEAWSGGMVNGSAGPVTFGGPPFCLYTVEFSNISGSLNLNTTGGGTAGLTAIQTERLATPPCGDIQPAPVHNDQYTSTSVTRVGNNVTATFAPVGNPISATLTFVGTMSADEESVTGTFTWHRTDQTAEILNWTVIAPGTLTRTPPPESLTPSLVFTGSEFYSVEGTNFVRYRLGVTNYRAYAAELFAPRPDLPPCGLNTSASRTWVDIYDATTNGRIYGFCALQSPADLSLIWFARPVGTPPPSQVYIKLTDRATGAVYTSNNVTPLSPP